MIALGPLRWTQTLVLASLLLRPFAVTGAWAPPAEPDIPPLIGDTYPQDADGDHIADTLFAQAQQLDAFFKNLANIEGKSRPKAGLEPSVDVELVFNRQITQAQIDAFSAL